MRKMITREITHTTAKVSKIVSVEGKPQLETLPDEIFVGNVSMEKAQKEVNKKYGEPVSVFEVVSNTEVYELPVETFLEFATLKTEQTEADLPDQA